MTAADTTPSRLAATIGSALVVVTTCAALILGMLSPMAADSCGPGSTEPECVNEGKYAALLTVGPAVLGVAALGAVWFRARRRPRLIWFVVWAPLLAAIFLMGNSLAGGKVF
jgi:ammonia channel protein AmtB